MFLSSAPHRDPAVYGQSGYPRQDLDYYETPQSAVDSLLHIIGDDLPAYNVWEPFCGNGAITNIIADRCNRIVSTDIALYDGFEPDGLFDFFKIAPRSDFDSAVRLWRDKPTGENFRKIPRLTLETVGALKNFMPDCIISNPPYGGVAELCVRHAIDLMVEQKGDVFFLCRHDWDAAKRRAGLFDDPAFMGKIVLRHRPRWISGTKGAPRFSYSWYWWSHAKRLRAPASQAVIFYAP